MAVHRETILHQNTTSRCNIFYIRDEVNGLCPMTKPIGGRFECVRLLTGPARVLQFIGRLHHTFKLCVSIPASGLAGLTGFVHFRISITLQYAKIIIFMLFAVPVRCLNDIFSKHPPGSSAQAEKNMKINSIINRYVFREMLSPFLLSVLFFIFVFLMAKMIEIANWIVNYNLSLLAVLWMIIYSIPIFLMYIIPMSVMISVLLTFLRFSNDNEIIALKSSGQSFYGLLPPVVLFCFMGFALNIFISIYGMPWANQELKQLTLSVAASNVDIGLKERTFNDSFKDVMLYVNKVDIKNKELIDVFIEDKRQPEIVSTVIAPRGKLYSEPGKFIFHLMLYRGSIHQTNLEDRLANWNEFDTYRLSLDLQGALPRENDEEKHRTEMRPWELRQYIKNYGSKDKFYYKALLDYHRRFSIPVACFVFGLLAMPLGVHSKSAKRSLGLVLGLFFFLFYYLLLSVGMDFSKRAVIPAVVAMWLPNIVIGAAGVYFFMRASRE